MPEQIILASSSPFRKSLLANAGIAFAAVKPDIDERAVEAPLEGSGATPEDVALVLADAKAADVSERNPGSAGHRLATRHCRSATRYSTSRRTWRRARRHLLALSGQDASAEQRRRAGARRRNAVVACRYRRG